MPSHDAATERTPGLLPDTRATATVECAEGCGYFAVLWEGSGGTRLDDCPSCDGRAEYASAILRNIRVTDEEPA